MDVEMLEPGARDCHDSYRGEIDQPHAVRRSCPVKAELSDSGTNDTVVIPEDNFDAMGRAFVVQVL